MLGSCLAKKVPPRDRIVTNHQWNQPFDFSGANSKWNHGLRSRPSVDFVKFGSWQQEKGASRKHIAEKFSSQESALLQNPNHDGLDLNIN